jgi:hypothetical protein
MRQCIFCGNRAGNREHLFPAWILKKVEPIKLAGFIGHNKNLVIEKEWTVKTICKTCNEGWMSKLETANEPLIGPPIDGKSILLDQLQRMFVAAWSAKTAMMMDSTTQSARPLFYTEDERHALMTSTEVPPRTTVWLGRFLGTVNLGAVSFNVSVREELWRDVWPTRVTTFLLGHLVIQVVTVHIHAVAVHASAEYRNRTIRISCTKGPWDEILVACWPPDGRNLYWPPVLAFHEDIGGMDFTALSDRYSIGRETPL